MTLSKTSVFIKENNRLFVFWLLPSVAWLLLCIYSSAFVATYKEGQYFLPPLFRGIGMYLVIASLPLLLTAHSLWSKFVNTDGHMPLQDTPDVYKTPILESQKAVNGSVHELNTLRSEMVEKQRIYEKRKYNISSRVYFLFALFIFLFISLNSYIEYGLIRWMSFQFKVLVAFIVPLVFYAVQMDSNKKERFRDKEIEMDYEIAKEKYEKYIELFDKAIDSSSVLTNTSEIISHTDGFAFNWNGEKYTGINQKDSFSHALVTAPTGQGKTQRVIFPSLLNIGSESLIVNDESGELLEAITNTKNENHKHLNHLSKSHKIIELNPFSENSIKWNPLSSINSFDDASFVAFCIVQSSTPDIAEAKFWNDQAEMLLCAVFYFFHLCELKDGHTYLTFDNVRKLLSKPKKDMTDAFLETNETQLIELFMTGYGNAAPETAANILNTASNAIKPYGTDAMRNMVRETTFDFSELREKSVALFITIPVQRRAEMVSFMTMFLNAVLAYLSHNDEGNSVKCLLDEFGSSFSHIKSFDSYISTLRKKRVAMLLVLQSQEQLRKHYPHAWETIRNNCNTKILLPGGDLSECEYTQRTCGSIQVPTISSSISRGNSQNNSEQESKSNQGEGDSINENHSITAKAIPVVTAKELRELDSNYAFVLSSNSKPIIAETKKFHEFVSESTRSVY